MLMDEHCTANPPRLEGPDLTALLTEVPGWSAEPDQGTLSRTFEFRNFHETMEFANAVAYLANREDHHPDMGLSYKRCVVHYTTHSAGGLSRNDFILAARIDALIR